MTEAADKPQLLLRHHLKQLKLPTVLAEYEKAQDCARSGVDHVRYLLRLCELELIERERRMVERRIRAARFPAVKGLDSFEFGAIPSLNKMLVLELSRGEYILRRENVIALGNSGTARATSPWLSVLPPASAAWRWDLRPPPGLSISSWRRAMRSGFCASRPNSPPISF